MIFVSFFLLVYEYKACVKKNKITNINKIINWNKKEENKMEKYHEHRHEIGELLVGCEYTIREVLKEIHRYPDNYHFERYYKDAKEDYNNAIDKWNRLLEETDFTSDVSEDDDLEEWYTNTLKRLNKCSEDLDEMRETQDRVTNEDELTHELNHLLDRCGNEMLGLLLKADSSQDDDYQEKRAEVEKLYEEVLEEWNRLIETDFVNSDLYSKYKAKIDKFGEQIDKYHERHKSVMEAYYLNRADQEGERGMERQREAEAESESEEKRQNNYIQGLRETYYENIQECKKELQSYKAEVARRGQDVCNPYEHDVYFYWKAATDAWSELGKTKHLNTRENDVMFNESDHIGDIIADYHSKYVNS